MFDKFGQLTFVALDGDTPPGLHFDELPSAGAVEARVVNAFQPFCSDSIKIVRSIIGVASITSNEQFHLIYVYGHAWLENNVPYTSCRDAEGALIESASELLTRLLAGSEPAKTVFVLDCCHAASFDRYLAEYGLRLAVYACGERENAIALHGEEASRLSLAFSNTLDTGSAHVDLINVVAIIAQKLDADGVLSGQTVTYRTHGRSILFARSELKTDLRPREQSVRLIRNGLIATGAVVATAFIWFGWFYWSHSLVEINLASLTPIADNIVLWTSEERPESNERIVIEKRSVGDNRHRIWIPSSNVLLRVTADYNDGHEREMAFHLNLKPQFSPFGKWISLTLPTTVEFERHPDMAYIPVTSWFHGREQEQRTNSRPYWIDLRPPTVREYLPIAHELLQDNVLGVKGSLLISWRQKRSAVDNLGLDSLKQLNKDLSDIFAIIDSANSEDVAGGGDVAVGLGEIPCSACPAPMFRKEAELYCKKKKKRLPTNLEWELAVRGVDGRTYPWGNQFDESRANVPGLPNKGAGVPALKPVDAYQMERSPFGLSDTVGNAGDWVVNATGSYERVYMGATYRFNPEDATAFRMLPVTDADALVREITVRCASDAGQ